MDNEKMRTTLYIDRELYYEGKKLALSKRQSTTQLINNALAFYLREAKEGNVDLEPARQESRSDIVKRIRKHGYRSGMGDGVKFQRWVRS